VFSPDDKRLFMEAYGIITESMNSESDRRSTFINIFFVFLASTSGFLAVGLSSESLNPNYIKYLIIIPILNCFLAYIANKVSTACYRKFLDHVVISYQLEILLGIDSFIPDRWKIDSIAKVIQPALDQINQGYKQVAATSQGYLPFNMKAIFEAAHLDYSELSNAKQKFIDDYLYKGTNLHIAIFLYTVLIANFVTFLGLMFIIF